jgi:hypothetical protein
MAAALAVLLMAGRASAQTTTPPTADREQFFLGVSAGGLLPSTLVTSNATATIYSQNAALAERRDVSGGVLIDLSAGLPVHDRFAIGLGVARRAATSDSAIAASIPHPLFTDSPRAVSTTITGMKSTQTWVNLAAIYTLPHRNRMTVRLFGGPALAFVQHDTAASFTATESTSVSQPTIAVTKGEVSKGFWGLTAGLDVSYAFNPTVGVGGFFRYSGAQANITGAESVTIGGVEAGVGLRLSFAKR